MPSTLLGDSGVWRHHDARDRFSAQVYRHGQICWGLFSGTLITCRPLPGSAGHRTTVEIVAIYTVPITIVHRRVHPCSTFLCCKRFMNLHMCTVQCIVRCVKAWINPGLIQYCPVRRFQSCQSLGVIRRTAPAAIAFQT